MSNAEKLVTESDLESMFTRAWKNRHRPRREPEGGGRAITAKTADIAKRLTENIDPDECRERRYREALDDAEKFRREAEKAIGRELETERAAADYARMLADSAERAKKHLTNDQLGIFEILLRNRQFTSFDEIIEGMSYPKDMLDDTLAKALTRLRSRLQDRLKNEPDRWEMEVSRAKRHVKWIKRADRPD